MQWVPKHGASKKEKKQRYKNFSPTRVWHGPEDKPKVATRVHRVHRRKPGALFASFLARSFERTGLGMARSIDDLGKVSLPVCLSTKSCIKAPGQLCEAQILTEGLELLMRGKRKELGDLLVMRFLALEFSVRENGEWKQAKLYELRTEQTATLAGAKL